MCQRMVLQHQSEHHRAWRQIYWQEHVEPWYKCVRTLGGIAKVSSEVPRPSHFANLDLLHCSCPPLSVQQIALTGAAPPALDACRSQVWRAGQMHLDAYETMEPSGACSQPVHHNCRLLAGGLLSKKRRKSRLCALRHAATRRAIDPRPSLGPCQVSCLEVQPLSQAHGTRKSCLRERGKSDFSRFGEAHCTRAKSEKMSERGSERFGLYFYAYSNVYQPVGSLGSNLIIFTITLNQVARCARSALWSR